MQNLIAKLSLREKLILVVAGSVLLVLLIHGLVIEPYQHSAASLSQQIEQAKSDLKWMQDEVQRLPAGNTTKPTVSFSGSLASLINREVAGQNLNSYLTQMTPVDDSEIRIRYAAIDFNQLISFIAGLQDQGLAVKDLHINSTSNNATVDATIIFSKRI